MCGSVAALLSWCLAAIVATAGCAGSARVSVQCDCMQGILQQGKQQGTWQLLTADEEDDGQLQLAGQVTMRFAWRSALA